MSDIQGLVAENRNRVRRREASFIEVAERNNISLDFGSNIFVIDVSIEVFTRPLGSGLISGHPDGTEHGSGHGTAGDTRGNWTLVADTAESAVYTSGGRSALREALNGSTRGLQTGTIGTGTTDASPADTSLSQPTTQASAFPIKDATNITRGRSIYGFADHAQSATEFGLLDDTGRLIARVTTTDISPTQEQEIRVGVRLTVNGDGQGTAVVPDDGEEAVADSLANRLENVGFDELAWGTGTTDFVKSDSALTNEKIRKTAVRDNGLGTLELSRRNPEREPADPDLTLGEVGVFDNTGRAVFLTTFTPFEYNEETEFDTTVTFSFS